jgi:hypothetical protein
MDRGGGRERESVSEDGRRRGRAYAAIVWRVTEELWSAVPSRLDVLRHGLVLAIEPSAVQWGEGRREGEVTQPMARQGKGGERGNRPGETEVTDGKVAVSVDEKVGRFQISMEHIGGVNVLQSSQDLWVRARGSKEGRESEGQTLGGGGTW